MSEWEVVQFLHLFNDFLIDIPIIFLVLENGIGLNECQSLIIFINRFILLLLQNHISLKSKLSLLIILLDDSLISLSLLLFVDLVYDLVE